MNSGNCTQCRRGSLSNDVFERRTSSGSGLFELFGRDFEQILKHRFYRSKDTYKFSSAKAY